MLRLGHGEAAMPSSASWWRLLNKQGRARTIVLTLPAEVKAAAPAYATARKRRPAGSRQVCAKPLACDIQSDGRHQKKPCNHCGFAARPAQHRRNINIDTP